MVDTAIWVAVISCILGPVIVSWVKNKQRDRLVQEVHYQVKNNHETNFRDDLDEVKAEIRAMREDARQEREERIQLTKQLIQITERLNREDSHAHSVAS